MLSETALKRIKEVYMAGSKIQLISMDDPQAPLEGTIGEVRYVDDIGTVHVKWENGSSLGLVVGKDRFCKLY